MAQAVLAEEADRLLVREVEELLLDFEGKASQAHDLVHTRPTDALPLGDVALALDLAGLKERLPLNGLAEELNRPWYPRCLGRFRLASGWRDSADDLASGHLAC